MIEFRHAGKTYADGTVAVGDFSLVAPSSRITVLVGTSGCGKSTLLRMVNRMVQPTSGSVWIDDLDVATTDPVALRRRIGYVMQAVGLLPHRRVVDNIVTVPRLNRVPAAVARHRALELLELVGLDPALARRYPAQLSGGQQQRVGVARALAADPNILLMDEPFGAVDPIVRGELQAELLRLQRDLHKTILFVTHDLSEALLLGDQIVILRPGAQIAQVGSGAQILAQPADDFVAEFVGLAGERRLHVSPTDGVAVVVNAAGRPVGVLAP